jgi:hypothetical protein
MKTIEIELSPKSIDKAIEELDFISHIDTVCQDLALIGADEATRRFMRGSQDGNNDWDVEVVPIENGWKIVASGKDVYFIEFGTGFFAHPNGYETSVPVYPGSWSEQHAQMFSRYGFWYYKGEKLQGTEAQNAMYYAGKAIRDNVNRVIEKVMNR